ncbi:ras guanine nucleotide exchange factor domain-containing protein [Entophlyctis helioformis]|nr:ras guanine nucleotide exchange factor domain-containing protein [Entophlyctis helioformis]
MDLIDAVARADMPLVYRLLDPDNEAHADTNFSNPDDGRTALHVAASTANIACLDILLRQPNADLLALDHQGNTPLHIAASSGDIECLRLILSHGPDLFIKNKAGLRPCDCAQNTHTEHLLQERMNAAKNAAQDSIQLGLLAHSRDSCVVPQWKKTQLGQLVKELPSDIGSLKELCIDLLINQNVFEERCKEAIRQLIEEKHAVMYKNRLLEQAAGIPDHDSGERYLGQLQFWQDETERQAATISYLKLRIQVLETTTVQQEEYYRQNLSELTRQQKEQIQAIFKRAEETERAFLNYQKKHSEELAKASQLRHDLLHANAGANDEGASATADQQMARMQQELLDVHRQLGEAQAQRVTLEERLKLAENLKSLSEKEAQDLRSDIDKLRKNNMADKVISQIQENQQEQDKKDEKDESLGEIVFLKSETGQKSVKAGTVPKLVQRLLDPNTYDNQFMQAFLLTHTVYLESKEFLEMIVGICRESMAAVKAAATNGEQAPNSTPIVLKAVNIMKFWVEQYWSDFQSNPALLQLLTTFVDTLESPKLVQVLKTSVTRKLTGVEAPVIEMPTQFPKPILPKSLMKRYSSDVFTNNRESKLQDSVPRPISAPWSAFGKKSSDMALDLDVKLKLAELDPLEVARQLTLIEFELFAAIKAREFLDLAWMKDDKETKAPNIIRMVRWSNHVVHWLVTEIVSIKDNIRQRATMIEKILAIAQNLEKLNNFNGVKEVLAALQSSSVYRLKKTKELVGSKYLKAFEELKRLTSSELNYKNLRSKVHAVEPPLIPFPGVYQGDLVFLETCGKTKIDGGLINFQKFQKIASYVLELQTYQRVPYQLGPVIEIQEFLRVCSTLDDDQAYGLSLVCEPRS